MSTNTFDVQHGMEVFSSDGEKIGTVEEVFEGTGTGTESGAQATSTADESSFSTQNPSGFGFANPLGLDQNSMGNEDGGGFDATRDPMDLQAEYGTTATATRTTGDTGYFKVSEGGFLGLGAKDLFIPFTAIETVAADGVVTLSYAKDDVASNFNREPDGSDNSNTSDMPIV